MAKGYHQQHGVDYHETYIPVIKPATVRLVVYIAISRGWCLRQIDIQNAFLHGSLQEEIFMVQPPRFQHPQYPNYQCKLKRSLYGLRQAPRQCFSQLADALVQLGFVGSADSSLFIYRSHFHVIFFLIYIDDIIITGLDTQLVNNLITTLHKEFAVKDLGNLSSFFWELKPYTLLMVFT